MKLRTAALGILPLVLLALYANSRGVRDLAVDVREIRLPADGRATTTISIGGDTATLQIIDGERRIHIERIRAEGGRSVATVRAGVLPGAAMLEARAPGFRPKRIAVNLASVDIDSFGDGTPDYLRLEGADAEAFRQWFALLAESAYGMPAPQRPAEITDCAALLRFAYREALREHDGAWAGGFAFEALPALPAIEKYHYPFTPLGAGLFRIDEGSFAQFADAKTLRRLNSHFVSRDLGAARQGDLLFYRQDNPRMPDHAMIYLKESALGPDGPWAVYHTGPTDADPGEMRRPTIVDLLNHPEPQWRPSLANANFLGVYRWNILRTN